MTRIAERTYVKNTFVELKATPREGGGPAPERNRRNRALSDFSGLKQLEGEEGERRPSDDASLALPASSLAARAFADEAAPRHPAASWDSSQVYYVPMWVPAPDAAGAPDEDCAPPPAPPGSYAPQWAYGPCWPFSRAPTTLVLFGLPPELAQTDIVEVLDKKGYSGFYDFVFLPSDPKTGMHEGRALVNLTRHEHGLSLAARLHGFKSWGVSEDRTPCEVRWSLPLQGLAEHVEHARGHAANGAAAPSAGRPLLFSGGWQQPFPPALEADDAASAS